MKIIWSCLLLLSTLQAGSPLNARMLGRSGAGQARSAATAQPPKPLDGEFSLCVNQVRTLFKQNNYRSIDEQAHDARVRKVRFPGGYWKLNAIYIAVSEPEAGRWATYADWEDLIRHLQAWVSVRPKSTTARIASANALIGYAWKARGTGLASTVTEVGWNLFDKRLDQARKVLDQAAGLQEKCPHWYVLALQLEQWRGSREQFEALFRKAVATEPTYYYYYRVKATELLPRWHGKPGEWEKFVEVSTRELGGDEGDIVFFLVYTHMYDYYDLLFMNQHKDAWPRLLAGFHALEKRYGLSPQKLNEACYFAHFVGDTRTAKELFERIGNQSDLTVWRTKEVFDQARKYDETQQPELKIGTGK